MEGKERPAKTKLFPAKLPQSQTRRSVKLLGDGLGAELAIFRFSKYF